MTREQKLAETTKEISGSCIETIPIGTKFYIISILDHYSCCEGLAINLILNNEYTLI